METLFPAAAAPAVAPVYDLALVACVAQKRQTSQPIAAAELYTSQWFLVARAVAEARATKWAILSAFHELVLPDQKISTYERSLTDLRVREREAWGSRTASKIRQCFPEAKRILMLAGHTYAMFLLWPLRNGGAVVETPLQGLRIGEQMSWLTKAVRP